MLFSIILFTVMLLLAAGLWVAANSVRSVFLHNRERWTGLEKNLSPKVLQSLVSGVWMREIKIANLEAARDLAELIEIYPENCDFRGPLCDAIENSLLNFSEALRTGLRYLREPNWQCRDNEQFLVFVATDYTDQDEEPLEALHYLAASYERIQVAANHYHKARRLVNLQPYRVDALLFAVLQNRFSARNPNAYLGAGVY